MRQLLEEYPVLLTEAAVVERLRRAAGVPLHPRLVHALFLYQEPARRSLREIYQEYIDIAVAGGLPLILCTPTWRANRERLTEAGVGRNVNGDAVCFLRELARAARTGGPPIRIAGLIGCKNDCYAPAEALSAAAAERFHAWQVERLVEGGVDCLMAVTLPELGEAQGIARAMARSGSPYVISFVIDRSGRVLDGTPLFDAVRAVDNTVAPAPLGFVVNCAHPSFLRPESQPPALFERLIGYQANASSLDHCELDGAEELAVDDLDGWGSSMVELNRRYGVRILGGCCGTGAEHLRWLAERLGRP